MRSGTVGRVAMCPVRWSGSAATEETSRLVPNDTYVLLDACAHFCIRRWVTYS